MSDAAPRRLEIDEPHTPGAAGPRLAAALGWDRLPEVSDEQRQTDRAELDRAVSEMERLHGRRDAA
jgi:hypothetical protein